MRLLPVLAVAASLSIGASAAAAPGSPKVDAGLDRTVVTDEQLVSLSSAIVAGRVTDLRTGRDPQTRAIYTYVTIAVDAALKGAVGREIVLKQLGGTINDESLVVPQQAAFGTNERVLLFLETRPRDRTLYTAALWQGKWTIEGDAAVRRDPSRAALGSFQGDPDRRTLSAFVNRIRAASPSDTATFAASPSIDELHESAHLASAAAVHVRWNEFDTRTPIRVASPLDVVNANLARWSADTGFTFASGTGNNAQCFGAAASASITIVDRDACREVAAGGATSTIVAISTLTSGGRSLGRTSFARAISGYVLTTAAPSRQSVVAALTSILGLGGSFEQNAAIVYPRDTTAAALVPAAPEFVSATALGSTVSLIWNPPPGPVTTYIIEAGSSSGLANLANFPTEHPVPSFTATGVESGVYFVRIRAANADGVGPPSNELQLAVGGGCAPPGQPLGLTLISSGGGTVQLGWIASPGALTYIVEAGSAPGLTNIANIDLGGNNPALRATGVGAGIYYVRIRARNGCGTSAPSNEIVVVMPGSGGGQATLSVLFSPNPANSVPFALVCDATLARPQWMTNISITEQSGVGMNVTGARFFDYDASGRQVGFSTFTAGDFANFFTDCGSGTTHIPAGGQVCARNICWTLEGATSGTSVMFVDGVDDLGHALSFESNHLVLPVGGFITAAGACPYGDFCGNFTQGRAPAAIAGWAFAR